MLPFFSEYVLPYAILGSKLIVFNFRFMSENPVPCSLLLILENWKILCKTRRYPKIRSDRSSLYLSRLDSHAKENANSSYQRGNQIPLYIKKDKLNEILYKTHLQATLEWGKIWDLTRNSIHNTVKKNLFRKF
jgi:hypothetical protein